MAPDAAVGWLRILAVAVVLGGLTAGAGYVIGAGLRRLGGPRWATWLCGAAAALLAPAVLVGVAAYGAATYQPIGPDDPGDLPGLALVGMVMLSPILFCLGLPFALAGAYWGRKRGGGRAPNGVGAPPS